MSGAPRRAFDLFQVSPTSFSLRPTPHRASIPGTSTRSGTVDKLASLFKDRRWQFLVRLRFLVALTAQSVIHPDELFQNPEIAAALVFDYTRTGEGPLKTWEWTSDDPVRSVVPVWLSTGLAFKLLRLVIGPNPTGSSLFIAQRLAMFLCSLFVDFCLYSVSNSNLPSIIFACSPVAFTFLVRPFSNSLETVLLAGAFHTFHSIQSKTSTSVLPYAVYGALTALGIFTRISFLFFTIPLALAIAYRELARRTVSPLRTFHRGSATILAFGIVSLGLVGVDTFFFRGNSSSNEWILTPLNLLRYNTATSNLKAHGLHPRYLHALVNWPMLYGVGVWAGVVAVLERGSGTDGSRAGKRDTTSDEPTSNDTVTTLVLLSCCVIPTLLLSLQPHQEPRFLLPIIVPLCLLAAKASFFSIGTTSARRKRRIFWSLWALHAMIFTVLFGYLHQGGLLPTVFKLNQTLGSGEFCKVGNVDIIFWRTFMPPRHLLLPLTEESPIINVIDIAGAPILQLISTIHNSTSNRTLLVTPAYAFDSFLLNQTFERIQPLFDGRSFGIQLDMDRLGDLIGVGWSRLGLGVWEIGLNGQVTVPV